MQTSALTARFLIALPTLAVGERYAGIVLDADGHPTHHLILLPGTEVHTWQDSIEWAKAQGGDLPTRQELALLYANLKHQFEFAYYWSNEQSARVASDAWGQGFGYGNQGFLHMLAHEVRACAVRRLPID